MAKPASPPKVKFRTCALFNQTYVKHRQQVDAKLDDFRRMKTQDPLARFGGTDEHFSGGGPLKDTGLIHAHLTGDISVLYRRHGRDPTYIDLYAIASHDELGTGQPASIKLQKNMAKVLKSQVFEGRK